MNELQFSFVHDKHLSKQLVNDLRRCLRVLLNVTGFQNTVIDYIPPIRFF